MNVKFQVQVSQKGEFIFNAQDFLRNTAALHCATNKGSSIIPTLSPVAPNPTPFR